MNTGAREWDADTYDRVSDPQFNWGMEVLERLELAGSETVLDAGAGSGRVTAELVKRLPEGRVIALDGSEQMIAKAWTSPSSLCPSPWTSSSPRRRSTG